ncbi:hypothetical protein ES703_36016 [subsurface metagenome]
MGPVTDEEMARIDAMLVKVVNFVKERCRVNYYAVADYADCFWVKNARRNKMKLELTVRIDYGMSGIIST